MYHRQQSEDQYLLVLGRRSTGSAIIGFLIGIIISLINNFNIPGLIFFSLFVAYLTGTAFWGVYKLNRWFYKYRSKMPDPIWQIFRVPVWAAGILIGIMFYGAFQQFILLLALDDGSGKPTVLQSIIILTPYIGPKYADKINYSPHGKRRH
ncbi:hypothetical protein I0Q91_05355 [Halanaerobiaceae bacterium Z-7014]|uniref:Uncharacterized protein n=1 Tax=Halonatronomonas betaini TaxID=2778430 RepID=A0A931ATS2_9FIRM|nr:hypothetical protein [Halonatronomonas betaini]MBF8436494.1 hypothetical protein [Halonatronomonas betaini]